MFFTGKTGLIDNLAAGFLSKLVEPASIPRVPARERSKCYLEFLRILRIFRDNVAFQGSPSGGGRAASGGLQPWPRGADITKVT